MTHFALFSLEENFEIDKAALRQKYLVLSRTHHPDFADQTDASAQEEALAQTAIVNEAYRILQDDDARLHYLLLQKGYIEQDEKFQLPAGFLMEMMEVNENLAEANAAGDVAAQEAVLHTIAREKEKLMEVMKDLLKQMPLSQAQQQQLKLVYYQKKYLQRILDTGTNAANIAAR